MLENLFTNVFGRPKSKSSGGSRNPQQDLSAAGGQSSSAGLSQMTGPFSTSVPQMPQPPSLPYPPPAPYPSTTGVAPYYPSLPFSQPSLPNANWAGYPSGVGGTSQQPHSYPTGTLMTNQFSPLDSVPFEAKLTLTSSTNLVSLDHLFKEIKRAADVVDRADAYLRSNQSDYDFKVEQGLIYH